MASTELTDLTDDEGLRGFAETIRGRPEPIYACIERLEREIEECDRKPRASSPTADTVSSRPSSGMSVRSENDLAVNSNAETGSPNVTVGRSSGRKGGVDLSNPVYRLPLNVGWRRELVYRANLDQNMRRQADVYYYSPSGKKLRSTREVAEHLEGADLTVENFTFFKEPLGIDDPEKEIIRGAKIMKNRIDSPQHEGVDGQTGGVLEGKRTPKPKGPKGSSPDRHSSKPLKIKSVGSRLSISSPVSGAASPAKSPIGKEPGNSTPKSSLRRSISDGTKKSMLDADEAFEPIQPPFGIEKMTYAPPSEKVYFGHNPEQPLHNPLFSPRGFSSAAPDVAKVHPIQQTKKYSAPPANPAGGRDMCPMRCPLANKEPPTLQCSLCLCLYHSQCTGFLPNNNTSYVCKNCHLANSTVPSSPPQTPTNHVPGGRTGVKTSPVMSGSPVQRFPKPSPSITKVPQPKLVPVMTHVPLRQKSPFNQSMKYSKTKYPKMNSDTKNSKTIGNAVNAWPSSGAQNKFQENSLPQLPRYEADPTMFPQSIAIVNGHKFIVVPKPNMINISTPNSGQINNPKQGDNAPKMAEMNYPSGGAASNYSFRTPHNDMMDDQKGPNKAFVKSDSYPPGHVINFDNLPGEYGKFLYKGETGGFNMGGAKRSLSLDVINEDSPGGIKRKSRGPIPKIIPKIAKKAENGTAGQKTAGRGGKGAELKKNYFAEFFKANSKIGYNSLVQVFKYLKMRELASVACVCRLWKEIADTPALWKSVRMKNSQVNDWEGLAAALKRHGTSHLDLRKMLHQHPPEAADKTWDQFIEHISTVDSLISLDLCRCPASVVERVCERMPQLQTLTATSIRCTKLNPTPITALKNLQELRIKGMTGLTLTGSLKCLESLTQLKHLSITSVDELGKCECVSVGNLTMLESLELGECTGEVGGEDLLKNLTKLTRLRLEKCPSAHAGAVLLRAASELPELRQLELINFDIKPGFEEALGKCTNVKRLLIIPTYVSQSATTNRCVLEGVFNLRTTLTHFVWGVTLELLRVTELFIDQCDRNQAQAGATANAANNTNDGKQASPQAPVTNSPPKPRKPNGAGDCIPVLKPIPGLPSDDVRTSVMAGRPQVEILPLSSLQRLLVAELPNTRLKLLRIPCHQTWRQTFNDFD